MTDSLLDPVTLATAGVPRPEYPRPHFDRSHSWQPLNGVWDFARDSKHLVDGPGQEDWTESILVPFAWETEASGVEAQWLDRAWYRREFDLSGSLGQRGGRIILHFGAVHHACTVWIDGTEVGQHEGGYVPFEFDITDALAANAAHEVLVRVDAPVDKRRVAHGKQRSVPRDDYDGCSFTPTSGIWQSVWLETRPVTHLSDLQLRPTDTLDGITVRGTVSGPDVDTADVAVHLGDMGLVATVNAGELHDGLTLDVSSPRPWSPSDPHLYEVTVIVASEHGEDRVTAATGLRRFETRGRELYLNGARISMRGVLDQGYWPRTGLTAPDDDAFVRDLEIAQQAGFNLVRKHLKLEDPRFHYHADRLGMLVWAEPASTGRFSAEAAEAFAEQIEPMVRRDGNHPSIVIWGLYNEEWGLDWALPDDPAKQDVVRDAFQLIKRLDPSRPAVDNSGWTHLETDLVDWHVYDEKPAGWAGKVQNLVTEPAPSFPVAIAVDSIVDKALMVEGQVPSGVPFVNSEFGGGYTSIERGWNLHWQTQELRRHDSIAGYVWTELNDIEHETAGIVDFERHLRDHGGRPPADANAETVTVFDITPLEPGRDLVTSDGVARLGVAVSHHGPTPIEVQILTAWGPVFSETATQTPERSAAIHVEPFRLSSTVPLEVALPGGVSAARLHVTLSTHGETIGHGSVDVVRD